MDAPEKLADTAAATSISMWIISHALEWMPVLQAVSLAIGIIAGILGAVVYMIRIVDRFRRN